MRIVGLILPFVFLLPITSLFSQDTSSVTVWFPPVQLTDSTFDAYLPRIALSGDDTVHITWRESFAKHRIPYVRSMDGGASWENVQDLITDTADYPYPFVHNDIVTQGQKVYMFSANEYNIKKPILMTVSTDGGSNWNTGVRVGPDSVVGMYSVNLLDDTLIVVYAPWQHGFSQEPRLIYSTDAGLTWTRIPDTLDGYTRTAYASGTLHLLRSVVINNALEVLYRRSYDLGNTFPQSEILSKIDGYHAVDFALTSAPSNSNLDKLVVSWRDGRACAGFIGCTIIKRESNNNGNDWTPEEVLTNEPWGSSPSVAINGQGAIAIAWDAEVVFDRYYHVESRFRKSQTSSWLPIIDHTPAIENAGNVFIALSNKAIHIVWAQNVGGDLGNFRIFYRRGVLYHKTNTIPYEQEWNLVSLPVKTDSMYRLPSLFGYNGNYTSAASMEPGKGYWAKLQGSGPDSQITYAGSDVLIDTVEVIRGWNIVGSLSCPLHVSTVQTVPSGIIGSNFFGYANGAYYKAEVIEPGKGYWVKVSEPGKLILIAGSMASAPVLARIVSGDELPPPPPGVEDELRSIPREVSLAQNYPNPFNPTTTIHYTLSEDVYMTLKVYDILGREVATLAEGMQTAGYKSVRFDAATFPSGVYLYKLNAGGFSRVQKMLVTK